MAGVIYQGVGMKLTHTAIHEIGNQQGHTV